MSLALATKSEGRARRSGAGEAAGVPVAVSFTMPMPPSVNQLFRNLPGKGRVKTEAYFDWRSFAVTSIRQQQIGGLTGRVLVLLGVERMSLSADIDNRIKAMFDVMVEAKVIADDRFVTAFAVSWLPAANGLAHVQVLPVGRLDLKFLPSSDGATGGWFSSAPQPNGEEDGSVPL